MREPTTDLLRQLIEIMRKSQARRLSAAARQPAKPKRTPATPLGYARS